MNTDPIADMLTRIRNAIAAGAGRVLVPYSKTKEAITKILKSNRLIADYQVDASGPFRTLVISLHSDKTDPAITTLTRISKPGRRVYAGSRDIPATGQGRGIVIVSTPKGVMTGYEARRQGLGGELICKVW